MRALPLVDNPEMCAREMTKHVSSNGKASDSKPEDEGSIPSACAKCKVECVTVSFLRSECNALKHLICIKCYRCCESGDWL